MRQIARRGLIVGAGALAAGPVWAQAPAANPKVTITTGGLRIWPCITGFLAVPLVGRARMACTTSMPLTTRPKAAKPRLSPGLEGSASYEGASPRQTEKSA